MLSKSHHRLLGAVAVASCTLALAGTAGTAAAHAPAAAGGRTHTVYTTTNAAAGNAVLSLRSEAGALVAVASTPTGGTGTGGGLGSQGAVVVDDDLLYAVDAGSDDVAVFHIADDGSLSLLDREPSGGDVPVSVTVHDDVVYVLNAGDASVVGLRLDDGDLQPIAGARQTLHGAGFAEIAFDHAGRNLVVSEKATNTLEVLRVRDGVAGAPVLSPSSGPTPFGFAIDRKGHVIVSNAAGGAAGASSLSSYAIERSGALRDVSAAVPTTQTAACWVALSVDERFAYDTNAGSGTISRYAIGSDGTLSLVEAVAASPGAGPVDIVATRDSLFTLNNGSHTVSVHAIAADGSLAAVTSAAVPVGATGLAAV